MVGGLDLWFIFGLGGVVGHADEEVVGVVLGVVLFKVVADDAPVGRLDGAIGVPVRCIEIYPL